jgi:hypothetical protein
MARIKPYRVCDICGRQYEKRDNATKIKVKQYEEPVFYDDHGHWIKIDMCPECAGDMNVYICRKVNARKNVDGYIAP